MSVAVRTPSAVEPARPASPNYFALAVEPAAAGPRDPNFGPRDNWGTPTSSIHSFVVQTPTQIAVEPNPEFEAFRKQAEANQNLSLSSGQAGVSQFSLNPNLTNLASKRKATKSNDHASPRAAETTTMSPALSSGSPQAGSASPSTTQTHGLPALSSTPAQKRVLSHADDRHPRLSLPGFRLGRQQTPISRPHSAKPDPQQLPSGYDDGPAVISIPDLSDLITRQHPPEYLLLDLRVAPQYAQSRIRTALNLCIPTTLLKRPSFNLAKLTDTFKNAEKAQFSRWKSCDYIIVYDSKSSERRDSMAATNVIKKFTTEGWKGKSYMLDGGFASFSSARDDLIDREPTAEMRSTASLSLNSVAPDVAPVAGGCALPATKSAANPFFSNIRQNMDLVGGVGQLEVKRPDVPDSFLPSWLRKAAATEDCGKLVSEKFLHIEEEELSRMQKALTTRVSYGSSAAESEKVIQIAGFEKGGKNRYNNIWPFEHARVRLQGRPEGACDYVNASHIRSAWSNKRYIASQGPLPATFEDFWSVVWSQDVRVIVMLTAESEGGQLKCHPYWADPEYGQFVVKVISEKKVFVNPHQNRRGSRQDSFGRPLGANLNEPYATVRKLALSHSAQPFAPMREITQVHFAAWPDFGTPAQPSHLLGLVELCNSMQRAALPPAVSSQIKVDDPEPGDLSQPMLVHCSAGCGRTGTFCAVDSVIDMLKRQRKEQNSGSVPMSMDFAGAGAGAGQADYLCKGRMPEDPGNNWVFDTDADLIEQTVKDFRKQRLSMVQTLRQYVLCYETVMEWINSQVHARKGERSRSGSLNPQEEGA